ncbi:hypothetical protein IH979_03465 [Patescibacteria group bacterium]|nr:hypothetical protein [Patescibacteria group bacterium]
MPVGKSLASLLTQIKVMLLKFVGASKIEISSSGGRYVLASGIRQTYIAENKIRCCWQLFSYYMLYSLVLVFLTKPIDIEASENAGELIAFAVDNDAPSQMINLTILAVTNVVTDLMSLAVTFVLLTQIAGAFSDKGYLRACCLTLVDFAIAFFLFVISQVVSNNLYPFAIKTPPSDFNPWSIDAALMPYAFLESVEGSVQSFYPFTFPGQIFITGTVFVPTAISMAIVFTLTLLLLFGRVAKRLQDIFLGEPNVLEGLGPAPIAGGVGVYPNGRTDRCLRYALQSGLAIWSATIGGVSALYFSKLLGLV